MKQHILVTGGAGFIGSHLVDALIQRGHEVTIFDKKPASDCGHLHPDAGVIRADLTNPDATLLVKALEPDVIIHLAANANVAKSVADPAMDAENTYLTTVRLLDAAKELGVDKFIFASTGGALSSEETVLPTPEDRPSRPLSPYAKHKVASEHMGEFYREAHGVPFISLRFANVYGPRQSATMGEANVIATFASRMLDGKPTAINGSGLVTRDYVYIDDAIRAFLLALETKGVSGAFNIGSGKETSVLDLHLRLSVLTGNTEAPAFKPAAKGEPQRSCLDITKSWEILGWSPTVSLDQGLERTVRWYASEQAPATQMQVAAVAA